MVVRLALQNFDPLAHAHEHLAESLMDDETLLIMHKALLDQVKFEEPPGHKIKFITAAPFSQHTGVFNADGIHQNMEHNMFIDDNLMTDMLANMCLAIVPSIEALYRIFG